MTQLRPFTARELAARLGRSTDWINRNVESLYAQGMPRPILARGKRTWDRPGMEAWLGRHHPCAPPAPPANDAGPPAVPAGDTGWRAFLQRQYSGGT